jgi:hypothetical protein
MESEQRRRNAGTANICIPSPAQDPLLWHNLYFELTFNLLRLEDRQKNELVLSSIRAYHAANGEKKS